jgi:hypothetical protein
MGNPHMEQAGVLPDSTGSKPGATSPVSPAACMEAPATSERGSDGAMSARTLAIDAVRSRLDM